MLVRIGNLWPDVGERGATSTEAGPSLAPVSIKILWLILAELGPRSANSAQESAKLGQGCTNNLSKLLESGPRTTHKTNSSPSARPQFGRSHLLEELDGGAFNGEVESWRGCEKPIRFDLGLIRRPCLVDRGSISGRAGVG